MTKNEQQEISKLIEKGSAEAAGTAIKKIQEYSKALNYWDIYIPINILNGKLNNYYTKEINDENLDGLLADILSRLIKIFNKFVEINDEESNAALTPIYIFTTTAEIVARTLPPNIYQRLNNPLQYKDDYREWLPFCKDAISIESILKDLNKLGYEFHHVYLPEVLNEEHQDEIVNKINEQVEDVIAIVDLLAINKDNERLVQAFVDVRIKKVILPVDSYLKNEVKDYMAEVRDRIFRRLRRFVEPRVNCDLYDPELSGKLTMIKTLSRVLPAKNTRNRLVGTNQNSNLNGLPPSF